VHLNIPISKNSDNRLAVPAPHFKAEPLGAAEPKAALAAETRHRLAGGANATPQATRQGEPSGRERVQIAFKFQVYRNTDTHVNPQISINQAARQAIEGVHQQNFRSSAKSVQQHLPVIVAAPFGVRENHIPSAG
jgi:hypothetical protein